MTTHSTDVDGRRVVIVGGGTGGTVVANKLADALRGELEAGAVEVELVTDTPDHVYKPIFLYVAFDRKSVADSRRPHREILDRRVDCRLDHVTAIDTDEKRLTLEDGDSLGYDYLVIATGATLDPEAVDGLAEGGHHFYTADAAETLRDELATFTSGHLVLSTVGITHMCPAAPIEFALIVDDWLRERGRRDDIDFTYTYPVDGAHTIESIDDWVTPLLAARDIALETDFEVDSVDPDREHITATDGRTLEYDLLVTIPPHVGGPIVERAELGEEWIEVDNHTLEATRAEDVSALGDVTDVPTSKAGSAAHYQAGVVADRIASAVRGQTPTTTYDGRTLCFVEAGLDEATFVSFDYDLDPVVRPPSQFVHWAKLAYNESYWLTARGLL